mmetsp:Transcript_19998/g.46700  ORF Transcript_19998/g.46700 Transcript_19998/m.46700 type:complete len:281 (-) Transcript_19998:4281-5123(-)
MSIDTRSVTCGGASRRWATASATPGTTCSSASLTLSKALHASADTPSNPRERPPTSKRATSDAGAASSSPQAVVSATLRCIAPSTEANRRSAFLSGSRSSVGLRARVASMARTSRRRSMQSRTSCREVSGMFWRSESTSIVGRRSIVAADRTTTGRGLRPRSAPLAGSPRPTGGKAPARGAGGASQSAGRFSGESVAVDNELGSCWDMVECMQRATTSLRRWMMATASDGERVRSSTRGASAATIVCTDDESRLSGDSTTGRRTVARLEAASWRSTLTTG